MPRAPVSVFLALVMGALLTPAAAQTTAPPAKSATPTKAATPAKAPAKPALSPSDLPAAAIVDRNIAARGGLAAWRGLRTLAWSGKMDAGGGNRPVLQVPGMPKQPPPPPAGAQPTAEQVQLPFRLEMQRPRKSRLEIDFQGETALQVYDGSKGWKVRPFLNRHDVEDFTAAELKATEGQADLDGHLVDYNAKGTAVVAEGIETVEGQPAYRLKLTLKNGQVLHDWVDKKSFLEVRIEGTPRRLDGKPHAVMVYMRDYRKVDGLMIPHLLETSVQGVKRTEKIQIEKVQVNPPLDAARFTKPT